VSLLDRLVEVADIPASTPRFSHLTVTPQTDLSGFLHHCNTRYDWLVRPCSAGTFTLQETPSFAWRTNGARYPRVGVTRERRFAGTNFKPHKLLENAATPTSRVHAVLGGALIVGFTSRKILMDLRMPR
jgi:hypothetical protein